jgi:hypothetical protein
MLSIGSKGYHESDQSFLETPGMATKRDRYPIDIGDIRDRIEQCRIDASWSEMALAQKIRVLLKERLEQLEAQLSNPITPPGRVLKAIAQGQVISQEDLQAAAIDLGIDVAALEHLVEK